MNHFMLILGLAVAITPLVKAEEQEETPRQVLPIECSAEEVITRAVDEEVARVLPALEEAVEQDNNEAL